MLTNRTQVCLGEDDKLYAQGYFGSHQFSTMTKVLDNPVADVGLGYDHIIVLLQNSTVLVAGNASYLQILGVKSGFQQLVVGTDIVPKKVGIAQGVAYIFSKSKKLYFIGVCTSGLCKGLLGF